ncbi:hypothetical protein [Gabonibacter chumensis]|uniref:hypothetical protein n=1 Tax=Gabonibacter chumensis TaxID=2972474 RepID=UPI0025743577|nr:hypothetical protein [Gabonibacter chumensis]MCR9011540.1 hypothetical protein [Gabonibacter chumensis]
MLKNYLLFAVFFLLLFYACNKEEEEVFATEKMVDWFVIENKSGEVNQLIYDIYTHDNMSVFINDTIYQGDGGKDYFGNPVTDLVLFEPGYHVFSTDVFVSIKLSSDSAAMLKALHVIREKVLPLLPKSGTYRPSSILLVDTLYRGVNDLGTYIWGETALYPEGLKGVTLGELYKVPGMSDDELLIWGSRILASKSKNWIQVNHDKEVTEFSKITDEGLMWGTNYDKNVGLSPWETPEELSFFSWHSLLKNGGGYRSPSIENDLIEYITYVYAYGGREEKLKEKYKNYPKILRKFDLVKTLVEEFEATLKKNKQF